MQLWQPLLQRFLSACESGGDIYDIVPASYDTVLPNPQGALWRRTILMDTSCIDNDWRICSTGAL
jgi:hypothetical protein